MKVLVGQILKTVLVLFVITLVNANKIIEQYLNEAQSYDGSNQTQNIDKVNDPQEKCSDSLIAFEFIYDHVLYTKENVLESFSNVQSVQECQEFCRSKQECRSFIFYDGGCIFLSVTADALPGSQLVVPDSGGNYIYGEKFCLTHESRVPRPSLINRFPLYRLNSNYILKRIKSKSRQSCYNQCLEENEFICRSGNYDPLLKECELSDMNRFTMTNTHSIKPSKSQFYFENNGIYEPRERCHFKTANGRLPTHIDAFFDVENPNDCKIKCLSASSLCRSYSVLNKRLCLLTYDTESTRLLYTKNISYAIDDATTYEMVGCFDVELDCQREAMTLRVTSSSAFTGKIYAKGGSMQSCVNDITMRTLKFELEANYNDISCGLQQAKDGHFIGDFVIQHNDAVITSNDIWLKASCQYNLNNQVVESEQGYALIDSYNLKNSEAGLFGKNEFKIDMFVEKPNLQLRIRRLEYDNYTDLNEIPKIGDSLGVMVEVLDRSSPYDIFVRELVAYDAAGVDELQLIDEHGCPTEPLIFAEFNKIKRNPTVLAAQFSAFKFPNSDTVQFRALVSLCIPYCEPVQCQTGGGMLGNEPVKSYGRRKREAKYYEMKSDRENDILLSHSFKVEDIKVLQNYLQQDEFDAERQIKNTTTQLPKHIDFDQTDQCRTNAFMILAAILLVGLEIICMMIWTLFCFKK